MLTRAKVAFGMILAGHGVCIRRPILLQGKCSDMRRFESVRLGSEWWAQGGGAYTAPMPPPQALSLPDTRAGFSGGGSGGFMKTWSWLSDNGEEFAVDTSELFRAGVESAEDRMAVALRVSGSCFSEYLDAVSESEQENRKGKTPEEQRKALVAAAGSDYVKLGELFKQFGREDEATPSRKSAAAKASAALMSGEVANLTGRLHGKSASERVELMHETACYIVTVSKGIRRANAAPAIVRCALAIVRQRFGENADGFAALAA